MKSLSVTITKKVYLQAIRIVAIFTVIFNYSEIYGFMRFTAGITNE